MVTNTIVLIVVAAVVALLLTGMLAAVMYKTRTRQRLVEGETIRDQAEENVRHVRHQEAVADECAAEAHAAQVEVDIKTAGARRLHRQASARRSEAVTSRLQLNKVSNRVDSPR